METKKQSPEKSCLPTAATLPSAMNGNFGTSPLKKMGGTLTTWQPISHGRAWQTVRVVVHLEAVANRSRGSCRVVAVGFSSPSSLFFDVQEAGTLAQFALIGADQQVD
jgi:hypothetical protein